MRCHQAGLYATDGLPNSFGAHDVKLPRNAPTVFNSSLYVAEHWDGRFKDVEDQAEHALTALGLHNPDFAAAMDRVKAVPGYSELFRRAFPDDDAPISAANFGAAVGAFERTLTTPSRFDEFLRGKTDALSAAERRGLRIFIDTGCATCHEGVGVGGASFEKFGVFADYWSATHVETRDVGRFDVTGDPADRYVFKVPGLRNVTMTPPFFHDGSVEALERAVQIMAQVQLDKSLPETDVTSITEFLGALTGKVPANFVNSPVLPVAGFQAPTSATPSSASTPVAPVK
jgi:cytochrome c peroxidase